MSEGLNLLNIQSPCFVLNEQDFKQGIHEFDYALNNHFPHHIVGYSVKTNCLPDVVAKARDFGCFAEVVSDDELELALACGYGMKEIVFNGPMKSKSQFLEAVMGGAIVNIETHREIAWLKELPIDGH